MSFNESDARSVLNAYALGSATLELEPLRNAGGFSGAELWRVKLVRNTTFEALCLRRWPAEQSDQQRLNWIHSVLQHSEQNGATFVPVPWRTTNGNTVVAHGGHLWELAPWLPGVANYCEAPNRRKLTNALATLARFHRAVESFGGHNLQPATISGYSPGITARREQLGRLRNGGFERLRHAVRQTSARHLTDFRSRAESLLALFSVAAPTVENLLNSVTTVEVPLQPCLRDVWHEHILFTGDEVTGLIDFGAMRVDSIATDLARLLGSLTGSSRQDWNIGLAAYEAIRPLSANELRLLPAFDQSAALLSGMNWLQWLFVEGREFNDHTRVTARLDEALEKLRNF